MDAGIVGAIIGVSILAMVCGGVWIYDTCATRSNRDVRTFKVKNLFSHVEI
jgi:hypothetical protein